LQASHPDPYCLHNYGTTVWSHFNIRQWVKRANGSRAKLKQQMFAIKTQAGGKICRRDITF